MNVKRNLQDSLFRDIFKDPENQLRAYRSLHPDDTTATVSDLRTVTLESVIVDDIYNDLGFLVRDQLIILIEAQSTWSPNILVRELIYLSRTLERYIHDNEFDVYSSKLIPIPMPELYVVYTGDRKSVPEQLSLEEMHWKCESEFFKFNVKVISTESDNIIGQYLKAVGSLKNAMKTNDDIQKAVSDTIDECIRNGILSDYFTKHRKEAERYMLFFLQDEYISRTHDKTVRDEGREEGREEGRTEAVILLASSYRQTDPSLTAEDAVKRAAELLDPEHSLSIEDLIPRIR